MRTHNITGTTIVIEYPDPIVWLGDNNIVSVHSSNTSDSIGARITIQDPYLNVQILDYYSETNKLVFLLNDTLKNLFSDNLSSWNVMVEAYANNSLASSFAFSIKVYRGKSFSDRSHASARVIYWNDREELKKVQLFTYEGGTATINGHNYTLTAGISSINLYNESIGETATIHITTTANQPSTPSYLGDMWMNNITPSTSYDIKLKYIELCDGDAVMRLFYNDTDGCYRFIGGKITKEVDSSKGKNFYRIADKYRNVPYRHTTENSKTLTVVFPYVDYLAYITDIMYCDNLYAVNYNGDLVPVTITTNKLTSKDTINDYEVDVCISEEK